MDFLVAMIFVCHSPFQSSTSQYWSCKSSVLVLVLDIKVLVFGPQVLVLVMVLDKQVSNSSLCLSSHLKLLKQDFYRPDIADNLLVVEPTGQSTNVKMTDMK